MYIYISLVVFSLLISSSIYFIKSRVYKGIVFTLIYFFALLVPALRNFDVGTDSPMYANFLTFNYELVDWLHLIEPINALIYYFYILYGSGDFSDIFLIYAIITNFCMFFSIFKFSKNIPLSLSILFMFNCLYFTQINIMRQAAAVSLSMLSAMYLLKNNHKKYFLFSIIAFLFHSSAFICFLFPFLRYLARKNIFLISVLIFISISSISFLSNLFFNILLSGSDIFGKYDHYASGVNDEGSGKKIFILDFFILLCFILLSNFKKVINIDEFRFFFLFSIILLSFLFSIGFLGMDDMGLGRIHYYFYTGLIFGLPYIFIGIDKKYRAIIYLLFLIFLIINFILYLFVVHYDGYLPYSISITSIFQGYYDLY